jgi:putative acetyltransferase
LKRVELDVHTDNPGAIHLYEKFDFVVEGTKRLYSYGAGRWADAYFMARLAPGFAVR